MLAVALVFTGLMLGPNPPGSDDSTIPPGPASAREAGLRGLIYVQGQGISPDEIVERGLRDAELARVRAEYVERRAATPGTAEGQKDLALWCEQAGLKAESLAHFLVVNRLDDKDLDARNRLGLRYYRGSWKTEAEISAETIEAEAQARADRAWSLKIATWRKWLADPEHKAEATKALGEVRDPRAIPALRQTFGDRSTWEQEWAVRLFGRIDAPRASQILAELAVFGLDEPIRSAASRRLVTRDPRPFVGLLINWLHEPVRYHFVMQGTSGLLRVEGSSSIVERFYEPELKKGSTTQPAGPGLRANVVMPETNPGAIQAVRAREQTDVKAIERANFRIVQTNERVERILKTVTGMDFGQNAEPWTAWWTSELGYSYQSPPPPAPKPVVEDNVQVAYTSPPPPAVYVPPVFTPPYYPVRHACFGAGTPVLTRMGARPIEELRVGDQALTQDSTSGELYFRPILAIFHNKPAATLRLEIEGETIVATGIHRFWKAGRGWEMARDLRPGDRVRTVGGMAEVTSVKRDEVRPVFNLEVADGHSFFVGQHRALVHDNSLVAPTNAPFDAEPAEPRSTRR
jgi:Pretoxin HINT domain/HEAT repeats